jgi:hypothetical protein
MYYSRVYAWMLDNRTDTIPPSVHGQSGTTTSAPVLWSNSNCKIDTHIRITVQRLAAIDDNVQTHFAMGDYDDVETCLQTKIPR